MIKRIINLIIALLLIIGLSSCGEEGEKKTKADAFSMINVPSYEEKEIGKSMGIQRPAMRIGVNSKDQIIVNDNREKDSFCIVADSKGKKLAEYKNAAAGGALFTLDACDNRYVVDEKYNPEKEGNTNREVTYTLVTYNSKGEKQKFFDLGKRTYTDKQHGITDIAADSKGTVYLLLKKKCIEVIGADGKKAKDIPAPKADYIETDEEGNLLIGSFEGNNSLSSIQKLNPAKEDIIWTKELSSGSFIEGMKYNFKNKALYILTDKGILSCASDGNIGGFVFDLDMFSMLNSEINIGDIAFDSNMNIYIIASRGDLSSGTYTPLIYKYTPVKDRQKPKNQKTLTLALRYSDRFLESAVSTFQKAHPEIKVEIKDYSAVAANKSADGSVNDENAEDDYQKVISTELMSGKGADIIDVVGLPYKKFADKNLLVNLSEKIKTDNSFDSGKYQQSLLYACKYKDNLYIMPINFRFTTFGANKNIMKKEGINIDDIKWTWKEFLSIAEKITKDKNGDGNPDQYALPRMTPEEIFSYIYSEDYLNFIDYDAKTADFDSREFIEILNLADDFVKRKVCSPALDMTKLFEFTDSGTIGFMQHYMSTYQSLIMSRSLVNGEVRFLDMPCYSEKKNPKRFILGRTLSISNNSKMKAESWEFVKWLLSDEIQNSMGMDQFAVNLNSLKEQAKSQLSQKSMYDMYKKQGRNIRPLTQTDVDMVDKMIGELEAISYTDMQADRIVFDGVEEFFSGRKTAEEAARLIQNRINIYLGE